MVKQQKLTNKVVTCYEAGALGFHLHRRLEELGIKSDVVQARDWDDRCKGLKNDRLDGVANDPVATRIQASKEVGERAL